MSWSFDSSESGDPNWTDYDAKTNVKIEDAFQKKQESISLKIGFQNKPGIINYYCNYYCYYLSLFFIRIIHLCFDSLFRLSLLQIRFY